MERDEIIDNWYSVAHLPLDKDDPQIWAERVLVTGSRDWDDLWTVGHALVQCMHMKTLIHGNARGADKQAGYAAGLLIGEERVIAEDADWDRYGKAAGPIRNSQMLSLKPDFVLAFHPCIREARGTKDMVTKALKAGLTVQVHDGVGTPFRLFGEEGLLRIQKDSNAQTRFC